MVNTGLESIDIINDLGNTLKEILVDCKSGRKQFIFPTYPIKEASVPSLTIEVTGETPVPDSADDFLEEVTEGDFLKRFYYHKVTAQLKLYFFTSRQDIENKYLIKDKSYVMNNKLFNKSYSTYVWKEVIKNRNKFLKYLQEISMEGVEYAFEDGNHFWTSEMTFNIIYQTIWCDEWDINTGELVKSYTLTVNITEE